MDAVEAAVSAARRNRRFAAEESGPTISDQFPDRFEIRVLLRDLAK
jgi:hypothetical protein